MVENQKKYQTFLVLNSEKDTQKLAQFIAQKIIKKLREKTIPNQCFKLYLSGNLGTGKTTFSRYLIAALGYHGLVKSPSYSLIESYKIPYQNKSNQCYFEVYHLDLYRLNSIEELEFLDYKTCFEKASLMIIEWADNFLDYIDQPDIQIKFNYGKVKKAGNKTFGLREIVIESQEFKIEI